MKGDLRKVKTKEEKKKIRPFAKRLTWGIALTQFVVMALASYLIYMLAKSLVQEEEFQLCQRDLSLNRTTVQSTLSEVSLAVANHRAEIEENLDRPDKMGTIVEHIVTVNPHIRSCGISFVADYYPQKGRWFCPMAVKGDSVQVVKHRLIGDAANDYLKAEWFNQALQADSCYWSKPFYDSTDSTALVAWLVPVHDKQGRTVAVVGADLALDGFRDKHAVRMKDGHIDQVAFYNFIIDSDGSFIAHPDSSLIIKGNYFELAKTTADTIDDAVGRCMVARQEGAYRDEDGDPIHFDYFGYDKYNAYMFYQPIEGVNWTIAMAMPRLFIDGLGMVTGIVMLFFIALALLVTRIVGSIIIKRATKPLTQLAASAGEVAKGNFDASLPHIKHNDEIRQLRDAFEDMQLSLTKYVDELKQTTASKASIENELKIAHDIQMSMVPKSFPPYPERSDVDIFGMLTPAKDVGGDLFDFYIAPAREGGDRLCFCIGDVSGKGVPASLVMAVARSLFRNVSAHVDNPGSIVKAINEALVEGNDTSMFVTLFVGIIDLADGRLHYCNAGHNPPLLIGREVSYLPCDANLPVGLMSGVDFTVQDAVLHPGDTIFLYTDGLNEAEDAANAQFGDDRMEKVAATLLDEGGASPNMLVNRMLEAVSRFVNGAEQSDDLTMLAIKYLQKENGN